MRSSNYHLAMMAVVLAGMMAPAVPFTRRRGMKDAAGDAAAALQEIKASIGSIGDRLKALEASAGEFKSADLKALADEVKGLKGDLASVKGQVPPEFKSLDDKLTQRLNDLERKINERVADAGAGARKKTRTAKSFDKLVEALLNDGDIKGELKSLDSDLKQQDIFFDDQVISEYPLLGLAFRRPTRSDKPRFSYYDGIVVRRKGVQGSAQTQGTHVKVVLTVVTYDYQPTIEHEDMADDGSQLMDSETVASAEEIAAAVNEDLVTAWEAALVATAEIADALTEVELIECATPGTLTVADLVGLISALPMKYRRGAVFVVNPLMAATLRTLTDGQGKYLWAESLQEGTPARLCGYQVIEDEAVTDGRILFGNPRRGLAVMERQVPTLGNVERSANNYLPYFFGRYAVGRTAAKALKALDVGTASSEE